MRTYPKSWKWITEVEYDNRSVVHHWRTRKQAEEWMRYVVRARSNKALAASLILP